MITLIVNGELYGPDPISSPITLYEQLRECIVEHEFSLAQVLPLVTANTARILKLIKKAHSIRRRMPTSQARRES